MDGWPTVRGVPPTLQETGVTTSRRARLVTAAVALAVLAAACGGSAGKQREDIARPSPTPTATEEPTPEGRWPLTGEPVDEVVERPVLAAKIENTPAARPLVGIEQADIVYEQVVEGGVTRFAALFHSEVPERVGPIRSARLVDIDLLAPFTPILAFSGARPDVVTALVRSGRMGLVPDDGRPVFERDPSRSRSHDLFAFGPKAYTKGESLNEVGPVSSALVFDREPPAGGDPDGEELDIAMTSVATTGWSYDKDAGVYRRSQDGEPFEVEGEDAIGASTVVVVLTSVETGGCCDTAGNPFTVTDLTGSGDAVVLRDGLRYDVRWEKERATDHLLLVDADGQPFPLAPGPSWWHLTEPGAVPDVGAAGEESSSPSEDSEG